MEPVYIVSVVRDFEMYDRCVRNNPFCQAFRQVPLDNRAENLPVPVRYNQFLDTLQEDGWIIFCHEDWRLDEDLMPSLRDLDKGCLWGPIGIWLKECRHSDFMEVRGCVTDSFKDGSDPRRYRGFAMEGRVDSFDCQCLVVHSSLIRQHDLRFDENLTFDLYVEDFCVAAHVKAGIESRILPMRCQHYSRGTISQRFQDSLSYLQKKYAFAAKRYATIVGRHATFGGRMDKPVYYLHRTLGALLRYWFKK